MGNNSEAKMGIRMKIALLLSTSIFFTFLFALKFPAPPEDLRALLYFLYFVLAVYMVSGWWFQAWHLTDFRRKVGNLKFFLTILFEIILLMIGMYFLGLDISRTMKLLSVVVLATLYFSAVSGLYHLSNK